MVEVEAVADLCQPSYRDLRSGLRAFADLLSDLVFVVGADGEIQLANAVAAARVGVAAEELVGRNLYDLLADAVEFGGFLERCAASHVPLVGRLRLRASAGAETEFRCQGSLLTPTGDGEGAIFLVCRVPEENRHRASRLTQRIGELRSEMQRREEAEQELRRLAETLEERVQERTRALTEAIEALRAESEERSRVEETLRQAQKLDALGHMTGGIAHDFNNLLTVVIMNLDYIQQDPLVAEKYRRRIEMMNNAAHRSARLVRQLLAFARKQALEPEIVDLTDLLPGLLELVQRAIGEHIAVETAHTGPVWRTLLDAAQFEASILNLALNARDASAENGKLVIGVENVLLDDGYAARNPEIRAGQYVLVTVSDTGTGMTPDVAARAFEPFFTTKEPGKGTGLGLSMVYGFVRQMGGHVEIESAPRRGTKVKLYFPRAHDDVAKPELASQVPVATRGETVLVVEDNDGLRATIYDTLQDLGYKVEQASNAQDALAILSAGRRVDLLFTDIVLSGSVSGRRLAVAARALRPELKVLFTSGYSENSDAAREELDQSVELLTKPYRKEQFAAKLRKVLVAESE